MLAGNNLCRNAQRLHLAHSLHVLFGKRSNQFIGDRAVEQAADTVSEVIGSAAGNVHVGSGSNNTVMSNMAYAANVYHTVSVLTKEE